MTDYNWTLRIDDCGVYRLTDESLTQLWKIRTTFPADSQKARDTFYFLTNYNCYSSLFSARNVSPGFSVQTQSDFTDALLNLLVAFDGEPFQTFLYDTLIYNMPVENWFSPVPSDRNSVFSELVDSMQEIYFRQWQLNCAIGRSPFLPDVLDLPLLSYVRSEILKRFPFMNGLLEEAGRHFLSNDQFKKAYHTAFHNEPEEHFIALDYRVFLRFRSQHKNIRPNRFPENTLSFPGNLKAFVSGNSMTAVKGTTSFWQIVANSTPIARAQNFFDPDCTVLPCKDDLYVICLACGFDYNTFEAFRERIRKDAADDSLLSNNTFNDRDTLIQSYLRNIKSLYIRVYQKFYTGQYRAGEKDDPPFIRDLYEPLLILISIDEELYRKYSADNVPPETCLLYHRYMMVTHHNNKYHDKYDKWAHDPGNIGKNVIDFEHEYFLGIYSGNHKNGQDLQLQF